MKPVYKETARGRISFSYAVELRLMQALGIWILWTPDPWDCKSYPLNTGFRYDQIAVTTGFLYYNGAVIYTVPMCVPCVTPSYHVEHDDTQTASTNV